MKTSFISGTEFRSASESGNCIEVLPVGTEFRSASGYNGNCVEALPVGAEFRSASAAGNCVEALPAHAEFRSASNPSGSCVEALPEGAEFRSASGSGECVEALPVDAKFRSASVLNGACVEARPCMVIKDSKQAGVERGGQTWYTTLHVPAEDWQMFLDGIRAGLAPSELPGVHVQVRYQEPGLGKEGSLTEYVFTVDGDTDQLIYTQDEWETFTSGVRYGIFDLEPVKS